MKLFMQRAGIRFQLTIWYTAIFAGTLLVTAVGLWFGLRASINSTVDKQLRANARAIRENLEQEYHAGGLTAFQAELREEDDVKWAVRSRVADTSGKWIHSAPGADLWSVPAKPGPAVTVLVEGRPYRVLTIPYLLGFIQVGMPMEEFDEMLRGFTWIAVLASPLLLAIAYFGGYWMANRALQPLEESFRRVTQFTADASHELRTPVAIMQTTAEVALARPRTVAEHVQSWNAMVAQTERTARLIEDLLLLARADAGAGRLVFEDIDLAEVLRSVCSEISVLADTAGLRFSAEITGTSPHRGDEQALHRLFTILLDNAIKYTPAGGKVAVALHDHTITITDTGTGISAEDLPHIFDRFYRAAKDRSRKTGGSGLGLSIAQWIVAQHGGTIQVSSTPDQGATFTVQFPDLLGAS